MIEKIKKYNVDLNISKEIIDNFLREYDIWYSNNKEDMEKKLNEDIKLHEEFLSLFPKEKIEKMNIDEYVIGKKTESFCWWVERNLSDLGNIGGGRLTAYSRFGIYFDKEINDYVFGSKKTKKTKFGDNKEEIFKNIIQKILKLLNDLEKEKYDELIKNKLNPLFKNKLIYLYDPKNWIPIYSDDDLNFILEKLEIPYNNDDDRIIKRINLFVFFESLNRSDITPLLFMKFIYSEYKNLINDKEVKQISKIPKNISVKCIKLEDVSSIEKISSKLKVEKHGQINPLNYREIIIKNIIGKAGEEIVEKYLKSKEGKLRLNIDENREIESPCLGENRDDYKHYDFAYYEKDTNKKIYIEVKSSKSNDKNNIAFFISSAELKFAQENKDSHFIMYINLNNASIIKQIPISVIIDMFEPVKYEFKGKV